MSPIVKLNASTLLCFICLVLLSNAAGLGGDPSGSSDQTSAARTSSQLTL